MRGLLGKGLTWVQDRRDGVDGFLLKGMNPEEAEDAKTVMRAKRAGAGRFSAHRAALEAVMARAPAAYPELVERGSLIIMRMYEPSGGRLLAEKLDAKYPDLQAAGLTPHLQFNTYGGAAFWLGVGYVHVGEYEKAIAVLQEGLRRQPTFSTLVSELGIALEAAGRRDEAIALFEDWLGRREEMSEGAQYEVLLSYGEALIALGRLDEAEAAVNASLQIFPGTIQPLADLEDIAAIRRGEPAAERSLGMSKPHG